MQAAYVGDRDNLSTHLRRLDFTRLRRVLPQTEMATAFVIVSLVTLQHLLQVPSADDNSVVDTLAADRSH